MTIDKADEVTIKLTPAEYETLRRAVEDCYAYYRYASDFSLEHDDGAAMKRYEEKIDKLELIDIAMTAPEVMK